MSGQRWNWRTRRGLSLGLFVVAGLALSACSNSWLPGRGLYENSFSEAKASPTTRKYCYRTLGEVDCYPEPLPDAEARLMGWVDVDDPIPTR